MSDRSTAEELRRIRASRASEQKVPYQKTSTGSDRKLTSVVDGRKGDEKTVKADKQLLAHYSC